MKQLFHTPEGVRDVYGKECEKKKYLQDKINQTFHRYGYQNIETPTFEFFDVFGNQVGTTPSRELYKFFDREGNTLVLRPDFTPSITRAVSAYFHQEDMPVRLCYSGNTFVNNSSYQGRFKESTQMGVELFGDASVDADAEVIALMIDLLKETDLTEFQISIGQVDFFKALVEEAGFSESTVNELRQLISNKNYFGVEELVSSQNLSKDLEHVFNDLPTLFGSLEVLDHARELTKNPVALEAVNRLEELYRVLCAYGYQDYVSFDLGMLSKFSYYTGIIFQGYTYGTGEALAKGGRYNLLPGYFGNPAPAIGFGIVMEQVLSALDRQNIEVPSSRKKSLIVYKEKERELAIKLAASWRNENKEVQCMKWEEDRSKDEMIAYAKRLQFSRLVLPVSAEEIHEIDLCEKGV